MPGLTPIDEQTAPTPEPPAETKAYTVRHPDGPEAEVQAGSEAEAVTAYCRRHGIACGGHGDFEVSEAR
jgi:hypothetical protein